MIADMDRDALGEFVAAVWRKQGWETETATQRGDRFVVVERERPERERGLIWVVADAEGAVSAERLVRFDEFCRSKGIDEAAVVTTGDFTDDARARAGERGVGLLDGDALRDLVRDHDLDDLERRYAGSGTTATAGGSDPLSRIRARLAGLGVDADGLGIDLDGVRPRIDRIRAAGPPVSPRVIVAAVLVLAIIVAGALAGPPLLGLGGGDAAPTNPVTARSLEQDDADGTLLVSWDATRRDVIDPDPDDDVAFYPRENRTFLVVDLKVTNAGDGAIPVGKSGFLVEADGTLLGHQPLAGTDEFENRDLVPGDVLMGRIVFSVPTDAAEVTIIADGNALGPGNVSVRFSNDPELTVTTRA